MLDGILWFFENAGLAFYNIGYAAVHPRLWLDWSDSQAIMRFVYYGGSTEFFFATFVVFLCLTAAGLRWKAFMWGCVRALEGFANATGRFFAWAGLLMVFQQIVIVFVQRIFAQPDIGIGFGAVLRFDISWWAEELKLYNAMIVALCCAYTFVQGGHVRVDLLYSAVSYRRKRLVDMFGSLFFMMPAAVLTWLYAWFFMWRHLVTPKVSASDSLEQVLQKARAFRWNVETIGFSPNGFNAYFLFKVLMVAFTAMVFIQAVAFFFRSFLEYLEGEEAEGRFLDKDSLDSGQVELAGPQKLAHR